MARKHQWEIWKDRFVTGSDAVTLRALSQSPGAPAYGTLKNRSQSDGWEKARKDYRDLLVTRTREVTVETTAQVKARQAQTGSELAQLGKAALAVLIGEGGEGLGKLKIREAILLVQAGTDIERKALGLETLNLNLGRIGDVTKLSDAELAELRAEVTGLLTGIRGGSTQTRPEPN